MITIQSADSILKSVYLGAITDLLNTKVNPFLASIEKTSVDVTGKEIRRAIKMSIDGGVGAGDETGALPMASHAQYAAAVVTLKNLYGQIEISDKVLRAGSDERGAFTNILNQSLEGLLESSRFNLSRMIFGDGSGKLGELAPIGGADFELTDGIQTAIIEGMVVDLYDTTGKIIDERLSIVGMDRLAKTPVITFDRAVQSAVPCSMYVQGSRDKEITGIGAIFDVSKPLYGLDRDKYKILRPYINNKLEPVSDIVFQRAIDNVESYTSGTVDYIACAQDVKLAYQAYLSTYKRNIDIMELKGGYKSISYNGIPLVGERFVDNGIAYMLDSKSFRMHQLCDWQFIEGDSGKVLRQTQGKPTYTATLVKYCDLVCDKPNGQAKIILDTSI